ncbi:MAG: DMT family transporter [Bacteroidales bacterium]
MKNWYSHGAAIGGMLLFGLTFVWTKIIFNYYGPITTIFIRLIISFFILAAISKIFGNKEKVKKEDRLTMILSALASPFLYFYCENYGLELVSPTMASIIVATIPLFAPLAGFIFLREKMSLLNITGLAVSTGGIMFILVDKNFSFQADPKGVLFLFGAVFAAIWYSIMTRKLTKKYSAITIVKYQNIISSFYFAPFFFIQEYQDFISTPITTELVITMLELAFFASAVAFILFTFALKHLGVSRTNLYSNLIPVFTAMFSFFMIGETFSTDKILGMFVVVLGLYVSQINFKNIAFFKSKKEIISSK